MQLFLLHTREILIGLIRSVVGGDQHDDGTPCSYESLVSVPGRCFGQTRTSPFPWSKVLPIRKWDKPSF